MEETPGKLFLCATPIGNLDDMTFRAVKTLKEVDLIAAEDTRHTQKLLNHLNINKPLTSYHKFNKEEKGKKILGELKKGKNVALVSDAGTPGISDPGEELVHLVSQHNIDIVPVPGPSAAVAALSVSGLQTKKFVFEGFLPKKNTHKKKRLKELQDEHRTIIFYESPHRIKDLLKGIKKYLGNRKLCIARELTKKFEEIFRGKVDDALKKYSKEKPRGEFTVIVEGATHKKKENIWDKISVEEHLLIYIKRGMTKKEAISEVSKQRDMPKRKVYDIAISLNT